MMHARTQFGSLFLGSLRVYRALIPHRPCQFDWQALATKLRWTHFWGKWLESSPCTVGRGGLRVGRTSDFRAKTMASSCEQCCEHKLSSHRDESAFLRCRDPVFQILTFYWSHPGCIWLVAHIVSDRRVYESGMFHTMLTNACLGWTFPSYFRRAVPCVHCIWELLVTRASGDFWERIGGVYTFLLCGCNLHILHVLATLISLGPTSSWMQMRLYYYFF